MKSLTLALTLGALIGLSGCTVWDSVKDSVSESEATSRLIVNQMTLRIIEGADNPQERAQRIREIVVKVEDQVDSDTIARLDELEAAVRGEINWGELSMADQELVDIALVKARKALDDLIGDGVINADDIETVGTLLTWIDNAAARVQ